MHRFLPTAGAALTGVVMAAALPPWGWWPLAFVGLAALDRLIADQPRGVRFRRGLLAGLGLYVPSLAWMLDMTVPGYGIAAVAYAALMGLALAVVPASAPARWWALPGAIAVIELFRWSWPFGGVPLSSPAVGQVAGPLAPVLRVGGTLLLVEVTVVAGVAVAALVSRRWRAAAVAAGIVVVAVGGSAMAPRGHDVGTLDVALVQGGGPQGTRAVDTDEREVFDRHIEASAEVRTPVDLVVWPEDVVDVEGPLAANPEGDELAELARRLDATLIAGVVEGVDDERFRNASIAFDSEGRAVDRYDKVHRVPFGEYVPLRSLLEPFGGESLTSRDAIVGEHPARLDTPVGRLSVAISWEVFFGDRVREGVEDGGEVVLNPTNGSSFTGTLVQTQQVASSRMRAIESGRWVLQVAPTGFSAVIGPDGTVHRRTAVSEQAVLHDTVARRQGLTIYTRLGLLPGAVVAAAGLAVGLGLALRSRRGPEAPDNETVPVEGTTTDTGPDAGPDAEPAVVQDTRTAVSGASAAEDASAASGATVVEEDAEREEEAGDTRLGDDGRVPATSEPDGG